MIKQIDDETLDTAQSRIEKEIIVLYDDMNTELNELKEFSHSMANALNLLADNISLVLTCMELVLEKFNIDKPEEFKRTDTPRHNYI